MLVFEFSGFAYRNPGHVGKNVRRAWKTVKAMRAYRKASPLCEWCGRARRLQVHHFQPVSVAPELADDPTNFMTMCGSKCHLIVAHNGDFRSRYVPNLALLCAEQEVIKTRGAKK